MLIDIVRDIENQMDAFSKATFCEQERSFNHIESNIGYLFRRINARVLLSGTEYEKEALKKVVSIPDRLTNYFPMVRKLQNLINFALLKETKPVMTTFKPLSMGDKE